MRSSSPIIPPDSPLQRTLPGGNRKFVFTVSAILALHMFLLAAVLIQGCKRQDTAGTAPQDRSMETELELLTNPVTPEPATAAREPRFEIDEPDTPMPPTPAVTGAPPSTTANMRTPDTAAVPNVSTPPSAPAFEPTPAPAQPAPAARTVVYEVKRGDTLTRIARNHQTTVKAIREANGLRTDRILVGQKLKVPEGSATGAAAPQAR